MLCEIPGFLFLSTYPLNCTFRCELYSKRRRNCIAMIHCGELEENIIWQWFARYWDVQLSYHPCSWENLMGYGPVKHTVWKVLKVNSSAEIQYCVVVKKHSVWSPTPWAWALSLMSCLTLTKLFNYFVPQLPYL